MLVCFGAGGFDPWRSIRRRRLAGSDENDTNQALNDLSDGWCPGGFSVEVIGPFTQSFYREENYQCLPRLLAPSLWIPVRVFRNVSWPVMRVTRSESRTSCLIFQKSELSESFAHVQRAKRSTSSISSEMADHSLAVCSRTTMIMIVDLHEVEAFSGQVTKRIASFSR